MLLDVQNLQVAYLSEDGDRHIAVNGVNLSLGKGESLGIAGESGCGKSTLARALMGYTRHGSKIVGGSVSIGGKDIVALPEAQKASMRGRNIAMVPQNPLSSLTFHMRIGAQIDEILKRHEGLSKKQAKERSIELLAATGMPQPEEIYHRYPHELSGGQRQRVVIAAALACRPEILVLDEPTTALDKTTELKVLDLVSQLREQFDTTLIYISHDLNVIARVCDKVCIMRGGEVVETGDTYQTFVNPQMDYTRELLRAIPRIDAPGPVRKALDTPSDGPLLKISNLTYQYPSFGLGLPLFPKKNGPVAVADLSFGIERGKTLGLVGESGSGKSTVASLISGTIPVDSDQIEFDGSVLNQIASHRHKELRRRIQMVFQDPLSSLNPRLSIGSILTRPLRFFFGMNNADALREAARLLEKMQLSPSLLDRLPRELSGGQQQRVALARAFAAKPDLIICDEVTSALDVSVQANVLELLLEMQEDSGVSCLFISHDLGVIKRVADDVIVMQSGHVRDAGPTADVFANPTHPYTKLLMAAAQSVFETDAHETARNPHRAAQ